MTIWGQRRHRQGHARNRIAFWRFGRHYQHRGHHYPPRVAGRETDEKNWRRAFDINISGHYMLVDEACRHLLAQELPAAAVLTSPANAVMVKWGSEAYGISKSAVQPPGVGDWRWARLVRVNGALPATVVEGSTMFPCERVMVPLKKFESPSAMRSPRKICTANWQILTRSARSLN